MSLLAVKSVSVSEASGPHGESVSVSAAIGPQGESVSVSVIFWRQMAHGVSIVPVQKTY